MLVLRLFALLVAFGGGCMVMITIAVTLPRFDFVDEDFVVPFGIGLGIAGLALILWKASPWLARKALPRPTRVLCPSCGYDLEGAVSHRCNECGLALSEEFRSGDIAQAQDAPRQTDSEPASLSYSKPTHPAQRLMALQGTMAAAARTLGAFLIPVLIVPTLPLLIASTLALQDASIDVLQLIAMLSTLLGLGLGLVLCFVPWFWPRWTGRRLAPAIRVAASDGPADGAPANLAPGSAIVATGIARVLGVFGILAGFMLAAGFGAAAVDSLNEQWVRNGDVALLLAFSAAGLVAAALGVVPWIALRLTAKALGQNR